MYMQPRSQFVGSTSTSGMKKFAVFVLLGLLAVASAEKFASGGGGPGPGDGDFDQVPPTDISEAANVVVPTSVWMKCTVDVEVSSSTNPGIGTEEWWKKQYSIMDFIFKRCTTMGTDNTFEISPQNMVLPLPKGQAVNFELSEPDKTPWAFVPLYDQDLQNLPNRYGGTTWGTLTCHKPWTTAFIDLKGCTIVHGNSIASADAARKAALSMYGVAPTVGPTLPGKAGAALEPQLKDVVMAAPVTAGPSTSDSKPAAAAAAGAAAGAAKPAAEAAKPAAGAAAAKNA